MRKSVKKLIQFILELAFNSPYRSNPRVRVVKGGLWFLVGLGAAVGIVRMIRGLGATTNLTDLTPWGLWIGFDVVGGVALAAGGFVIAATVYIFHIHRYHSIVRPAVLTAFLGYGAVIVGLIFDLGRWWDIWHPMIYWQPHSALFEVAWCVMLYFTVLALEFAPVVFEKMPFPGIYKVLKTITLPLIILGIMLSTLHQSSLGTLFLIMPFRIYPLWYSKIMPWLFFISAIGLGLAMVILESLVSGWVYQRKEETGLLSGLAKACALVMGLYVAIRIGDLAYNGKLLYLAKPAWETADFIIELCLSVFIPIILFSIPRVRQSKAGLLAGSASAVLGVVLNRINVSGIATIPATKTNYFPAWTEFAISIGVVAAATLVFFFFVEHFSVFESEAEHSQEDTGLPFQDPVSNTYLGTTGMGNTALYSLIFILSMSIGIYLLPGHAITGKDLRRTPVKASGSIMVQKVPLPGQTLYTYSIVNDASSAESSNKNTRELQALLFIDDNGRFVVFDHKAHQMWIDKQFDRLKINHFIFTPLESTYSDNGDTSVNSVTPAEKTPPVFLTGFTIENLRQSNSGTTSCRLCHHMNYPFNQATSCRTCHRDMYLATDIFNHDFHIKKLEGNRSCSKCHKDPDAVKSLKTATPCTSCHKYMIARSSFIKLQDNPLERPAVSYMDAMHGLCRNCHHKVASLDPLHYNNLDTCATCHQRNNPDYLKGLPQYPKQGQRPIFSMEVPNDKDNYSLNENRALSLSR